MKISYQDVYSRFLQKVNDIELAQLPQVDVYEMMCGWMHSALSRPYTRTVFSKLKFYDEIMVLECSLANPVDDVFMNLTNVTFLTNYPSHSDPYSQWSS